VVICGDKIVFSGVSHINLDPKNRIAIPTRYRDLIANEHNNNVVVTLESQNCLLVYPEKVWLEIRDTIQNLATGAHPLVKSYQRLVLGYAETITLDKSGRILLPASLKNLIKLDKDLVLAGVGNKFELWNSIQWNSEIEKSLNVSQHELANVLNGLPLK
jgi:MraZ protein